jgi:hypothetical protein
MTWVVTFFFGGSGRIVTTLMFGVLLALAIVSAVRKEPIKSSQLLICVLPLALMHILVFYTLWEAARVLGSPETLNIYEPSVVITVSRDSLGLGLVQTCILFAARGFQAMRDMDGRRRG